MSAVRIHSVLVNAITLSRIPLIFGFMGFAIAAHFRGSGWLAFAAVALMFLAGISDLFDGILARRWRVVSVFGKLADPLMDKIFFIVSFPTLMWLIGVQGENGFHQVVMLSFTILYILRDQWVTFLRAVASTYHADVSAKWLGKVRTALSFPAAGYIYLYLAYHGAMPAELAQWMLWSVYGVEFFLIALNVYTCVTYTGEYWPHIVRAINER